LRATSGERGQDGAGTEEDNERCCEEATQDENSVQEGVGGDKRRVALDL
jgi:hypothetical protein